MKHFDREKAQLRDLDGRTMKGGNRAKSDAEADRLAALKDKVTELARALGMDVPGRQPSQIGIAATDGASAEAIRLAIAKSWILARKQRDKLIDGALFSDPAWDIMLDLYEKHHAGRAVTVTSACLASRAPVSTAFRQLSRLEQAGWVERSEDAFDGRKIHVSLTSRALVTMDQLMDNVLTAEQKELAMCGASALPGAAPGTRH